MKFFQDEQSNELIKATQLNFLTASPYPLLIQLHQLLSNFRRVECQAQAVDIELRHQVLQDLFEGQASS